MHVSNYSKLGEDQNPTALNKVSAQHRNVSVELALLFDLLPLFCFITDLRTPEMVLAQNLCILYSETRCCSVDQLCTTLCDTMDYSTAGFLVLHHLAELAQIHIH